MKNPCTVDCNKRNPTCHIECGEYKEWKEQDKELKDKMREDSKIHGFYRDVISSTHAGYSPLRQKGMR